MMLNEQPHLLIVDDDRRLRELLQRFLRENNFRVTTAENARSAREKLRALSFDLIILDIMMPGETGLDLTKSLRQESKVPVLFLTAMDGIEARIIGLEQGADDYLTKPFEPRELILRIQAILRRVSLARSNAESEKKVHFGAYTFEISKKELRRAGAYIHLTSAEADLLSQLAEHPGKTISREELALNDTDDGTLRTVDVKITRLRKKIEADPKNPRYLKTVRGIGYVLVID